MMVGFTRFFFLLGITAGILSNVTAFSSFNRTQDRRTDSKALSSSARVISEFCSTKDFRFPKSRIPKDDSLEITSDSMPSDFCGLKAKVREGQRMTLKCTEFSLPDDFQMHAISHSDHIQVTVDNLMHTFPEGDRILLFSVSGPRPIDLSSAFRCEVISSTPLDCKCGVSNVDKKLTSFEDRIIGGADAPEGKHPWMVGLSITQTLQPDVDEAYLYCGGTLITSTKIISAASCSPSIGEYAHIGEYDTTVEEEYTIVREITDTVYHPDYNPKTLDYDIAILTIESPVTFSSKISPICLPEADESYESETATAVGWGEVEYDEGAPLAEILQEVDVTVKSCATSFDPSTITNRMLCAGDANETTCYGDDGGPLLFREISEDPFELIGVTSANYGCSQNGNAGKFTRVTALKSFILENVGGEIALCPRP